VKNDYFAIIKEKVHLNVTSTHQQNKNNKQSDIFHYPLHIRQLWWNFKMSHDYANVRIEIDM